MHPAIFFKQHIKNVHFFKVISEFLQNLPYKPEIGPVSDTLDTKPIPAIYNVTGKAVNTEVVNLTVGNILQVYNYILPFLKSLEFKTRKSVDFLFGYLGGEGPDRDRWQYLVDISNYINTKRYSTHQNNLAENNNKIPDVKEIGLFWSETSPPFDLITGLTYRALSNQALKIKGSKKGIKVNVFDNDVLIEGSPFSTYTPLALGNISSIITKKINTGKLYKNRYKFETVNE